MCLTLLALAGPLAAETVYVTDELRLGLYESELTEGRPFKTLVSGAELDVLERALMSIRVRTEDGEEGWVKTAYVVSEEPARRRAARLEAAVAELEAANAEAASELAAAQDRVGELEADLDSLRGDIEGLPDLRAAHAELQAEVASTGRRVPLLWVIAAAAGALVIGALLGYVWLDRRIRSHFGGIRPY